MRARAALSTLCHASVCCVVAFIKKTDSQPDQKKKRGDTGLREKVRPRGHAVSTLGRPKCAQCRCVTRRRPSAPRSPGMASAVGALGAEDRHVGRHGGRLPHEEVARPGWVARRWNGGEGRCGMAAGRLRRRRARAPEAEVGRQVAWSRDGGCLERRRRSRAEAPPRAAFDRAASPPRLVESLASPLLQDDALACSARSEMALRSARQEQALRVPRPLGTGARPFYRPSRGRTEALLTGWPAGQVKRDLRQLFLGHLARQPTHHHRLRRGAPRQGGRQRIPIVGLLWMHRLNHVFAERLPDLFARSRRRQASATVDRGGHQSGRRVRDAAWFLRHAVACVRPPFDRAKQPKENSETT